MADALSMKSLHISALMVRELDLLEKFRDLSLICEVTPNSVRIVRICERVATHHDVV